MKKTGRPNDSTDQAFFSKKLTTIALHQAMRFECNNKEVLIRQEILDSRNHNSKLFHKHIHRQRGKIVNCVNKLHVGNETFRTESATLSGWHQHIKQLATPKDSPLCDSKCKSLVELEFSKIVDICQSYVRHIPYPLVEKY